MRMSFWESIKLAPTYDLVFAAISIILIIGAIVFFTYVGIKEHKARKAVDAFIFEHLDKISNIQNTIYKCKYLEEFDMVKRWAIASAENMYNEMVSISENAGHDEGKKLVLDIKHRLSIKEEELCKSEL